jgi:hypothetical protein
MAQERPLVAPFRPSPSMGEGIQLAAIPRSMR